MTSLRFAALAAALCAVIAAPAAAQVSGESSEPAASGLTLSGPWRIGPALENARAGLSAAALDGKIYAAGGAGVVDPRDEFELYDPDTGRWRALSPLPVGLERFGMAAFDDRIWIAGGYSAESAAEPVTDVRIYDPIGDFWETGPQLPGAKAAFELVAGEDALYAVGGDQAPGGLYVFDAEAQSWSAAPAPAEIARRGGDAVMLGGALYVIGGVLGDAASARVDVYDPRTGEWERAADLPAPRAGHSAVAMDGAIHVFGGRSADLRRTLADHLIYDAEAGAWSEGPGMVTARTEASAVVHDGEAWLIGGGAGAGVFAPFTALDSVDVYAPETDAQR